MEVISVIPQPKLCESFSKTSPDCIKLTINTLAAPNVIDDAGNRQTAAHMVGPVSAGFKFTRTR